MYKTHTETIENFTIQYKKHPFSKSIKATLKDENFILVTLPYFCPFKNARAFLLKNFEKIKNFTGLKNSKKYDTNFTTKFDTLKIIAKDELRYEKISNIIYFYYPKDSDFKEDFIQKEFRKAHLEALKIEARNYLPERLNFLALKYGFKYNKIALKNQKSRFGSCSYQNNINLNIILMKYDFSIIDYVLIHELVHTKIKNHSNSFWTEVQKYCPDYKELRKILKST